MEFLVKYGTAVELGVRNCRSEVAIRSIVVTSQVQREDRWAERGIPASTHVFVGATFQAVSLSPGQVAVEIRRIASLVSTL